MAAVEHQSPFEATPPKYDADYTARLLVYSFFFSQGNGDSQKRILSYIASRFRENLDVETINSVIPAVTKRAEAIHTNQKVHKVPYKNGAANISPIWEIQGQVRKNALRLQRAVITPILDSGIDLSKMAQDMIGSDFYYLSRESGRNRTDTQNKSPYADSYLSMWVYFGLIGQTTGMPEYDQMFIEMVEDSNVNEGYSGLFSEYVEGLIRVHTNHHPEQFGLLPEWVKKMHYTQGI